MKLDPRHLVQLAVILDSGTLRVAAERLGTTQPALSRTIAMMEERVGTALFERRRRPLTPTDTCLGLAAFGRTIRGAVVQAEGLSHQIASGLHGTIRIGAPPFSCDDLLSRMIGAFSKTRPHMRLALSSDYFPALVQEIQHHRLDMVIGPFELLGRQSALKVERIMPSSNVVVCRPGHELLRQKSVSLASLEKATWIGHARESMLATDMRAKLAEIGVNHLDVVFESNSAGAVLTVIRESDYLTVLPLLSIVERVAAGQLAVLPTPQSGPLRWTAIVTRADSTPTAALLELKQTLAAGIKAIAPLMDALSGPRHRHSGGKSSLSA
ncbi:MAG: LysR family transcriptional regulator [Pseudolabrys sp.]|nr:LysR family transcriptional regulator [Pseudolabrys sp.]